MNPLWCSSDIVEDLTESRSTWRDAIHELFHNVERAYGDVPKDTDWFYEGSARMSQDFFYTSIDTNPASTVLQRDRRFSRGVRRIRTSSSGRTTRCSSGSICASRPADSIVGQPYENFDAMDSFMRAAEGHEGEDAVQAYLDSLPVGHYWHSAEFDRFFGTWVTALYTRRFNASSMTPRYYYRDEQENLPSSLQRPVKIENCAYNAVSDSYPPEVIAANGSRFYNDADSNTWSRQLRPWRSNYFSFMPSNSSSSWCGRMGRRDSATTTPRWA